MAYLEQSNVEGIGRPSKSEESSSPRLNSRAKVIEIVVCRSLGVKRFRFTLRRSLYSMKEN